ncbi:MAG: hypothetical protein U0324_34785 [Polyangiales bacterium]
MTYPFLYVNHGVPDVESVGKCEEVFLWFERAVTPAERARVMQGCPAPIAHFAHWDDTFCYFGSDGDSYESTLLFEYAPKALREGFERTSPGRDVKAWRAAHARLQDSLSASVARFADEVERWVRGVHDVVPVALFWGPTGGPEDDPWHADSVARFAEVMYERVGACRPATRAGKTYLGFIRTICDDLLVAPPAKDARGDARSVATLDAAAAKALPRRYVSRLSYQEHDLLAVGELVARYLGDAPDDAARFARLAPATRLVYLASYAASSRRAVDRLADPAGAVRALVAALPPEADRAAVPLAVMMASTMAHDTPGFDRPRKKHAARAAAVLSMVLGHPRCTAGTWARCARYQRWAGARDDAAATLRAALARYGEKPVLLRAMARAAPTVAST